MKKNYIGLYLTDDKIYMCSKDKIYYENIKDGIIKNNRIANSEIFYKKFNDIIKRNKLNDSIIGKSILILDSPNYLKSDKELITSILEKISFNKIKFLSYDKIINSNNIVNVNNNNLIVFNKDKYVLIDFESLFIEKELDKDLISLISKYSSSLDNIFLVGNYKNINLLQSKLENLLNNKKIYTYHNGENFIINKLQNEITTL